MPIIDTKAALLQALIQGDSYGVEIIERVERLSGGHVKLMHGRVYPALRELETEGLLESYAHERSSGRSGRQPRYYRLTTSGRKIAHAHARAISGLLTFERSGL